MYQELDEVQWIYIEEVVETMERNWQLGPET